VICEELQKSGEFGEIVRELNRKGGSAGINGLPVSGMAHLVCAFFAETGKKCVCVLPDELAARKFRDDVLFFSGFNPDSVPLLKPLEYMLYDVDARSGESGFERVKILRNLAKGDWNLLIASPGAISQWLPEPERMAALGFTLRRGMQLEIPQLGDKLAGLGYIRVQQVDGMGQYAVRGDIVDIFPFSSGDPYRVEFFGDEIDTVRNFNVVSQRTVGTAEEFTVLPDRETYIWDEAQALDVRTEIKAEAFACDPTSLQARRMLADAEKIKPYCFFAGYDRYLPYILKNKWSLKDYCRDAVSFFIDPETIRETADQALDEHTRICETVRDNSGLPDKALTMYMDGAAAVDLLREGTDSYAVMSRFDDAFSGFSMINMRAGTVSSYGDNMPLLLKDVKTWTKEKYRVVILADSEGKAKRIKQLFLEELGVSAVSSTPEELRKGKLLPGAVYIANGSVSESFTYPQQKFVLISDGKLFRREKARVRRKLKGQAIESFTEMRPGDFVVHDVHGIGRFAGIEQVTVDGVLKDYIRIEYRDDGVLLVPTHQMDSVQRYIGDDENPPALSKLGSSEWKRTTAKVKNNLRAYAEELVELYAKRSRMEGFAYSPDTEWQKEFEEDFPYEETEDQLRCTEEIKADLEKARPMERLLCGDVGYGKTEVALRAAFKVAIEGRQVAFLAPTTVLTQQHYLNFVERFKQFPLKVDYLSRFRTAGERKKILKGLEEGKIDVIVGTHALISDKVVFKNLGLVIIDEEQRFGVKHKDKLKEKYPAVDMLSLSATPIPRTLHMSLSGIRDISLLEDPPQDRLPVQTYVAAWEPTIIKNAVYKEMARGGQVFYLFNRVQSMDQKLSELRELLPEARIVSAHGQMAERDLEQIVEDFIAGEFDILLCTTIIESGLDMPNVNTIIVENADRLGLSQLYQIRGRVGRSNRQAYAYITYRAGRELGEVAEKRLRTIRENTEFGSGFRIALRDLEIRGAGSVLGEMQHGQLAAVGYETYCKLLDEVLVETKEAKTGETHKRPAQPASVEIRCSSFISPDYIEDDEARFGIYQKIARVETEEDGDEVIDELIDRFGNVPDDVMNLITVARIRHAAERCGLKSVIGREQSVVFHFADTEFRNASGQGAAGAGHAVPAEKFKIFSDRYGRRVSFLNKKDSVTMTLQTTYRQGDNRVLGEILAFLTVWEDVFGDGNPQ